MIDNIVVGFEHAVGEPVRAHELPNIFLGIEFGERGGSGINEMFDGVLSDLAPCQPAWSKIRMAWACGATLAAMSSRWNCMASALQTGRTRPEPFPCSGQTAPNR